MRAFHIPIAFLSIWESILDQWDFIGNWCQRMCLENMYLETVKWVMMFLTGNTIFLSVDCFQIQQFYHMDLPNKIGFFLTWHFSHTILWVQWFLSKWFWWASSCLRYKCYGLWQLIFKLSAGSATVVLSFKSLFLCHALALFSTPLLLYLHIPSSISAKKKSQYISLGPITKFTWGPIDNMFTLRIF